MMGTAVTRQTSPSSRLGRKAVLVGIVVTVILAAAALLVEGCSDRVSEARNAELAGDFKTAEALYQEQLQSDANDLDALKGLAGVLYLERRWDEALPFQKKAIALDTKEAQIRVELGFNYLNHQNAPAEAVTVLKEACALEPTAQYLGFLAQAQMAARGPERGGGDSPQGRGGRQDLRPGVHASDLPSRGAGQDGRGGRDARES